MAAEIRTEYVTLSVSDGSSMRAYVARPGAGASPKGLLVFQEAFGVNAHIRDITDRFAREGYLAIAPELFHRTGPGFEAAYGNFQEVMPHMQALRIPGLEADSRAAYDWLRANGTGGDAPIAAIGYCMGGRTAVLAGISLPLNCAVSYYGGGIAPNAYSPGFLDRLKDLQVPVLLFWGGLDKNIDLAQRTSVVEGLRAAGKDFVNVEFSSADHGFFCDARASYNPSAAAEAWPLTLAFLRVHTSKDKGAAAG